MFRILILLLAILLVQEGCTDTSPEFLMEFPVDVDRPWIGPQIWTNPLQDWRLNDGRMECIVSGGERNAFMLTHRLSARPEPFEISVRAGTLFPDEKLSQGWIGFNLGVRGEFNDYRDDAVRGEGFPVGITTNGIPFIGGVNESDEWCSFPWNALKLIVRADPQGSAYLVTFSVLDADNKKIVEIHRDGIAMDWLTGGIRLECSAGTLPEFKESRPKDHYTYNAFKPGTQRSGDVRFWFDDLKAAGKKIDSQPGRSLGPVMFSQYTLSRGTLKLSAQMAPLGSADPQMVNLEVLKGEQWELLQTAEIDTLARVAVFKIADWDDSEDYLYRLVYQCKANGDRPETFYYEGVIRQDPKDKQQYVVAAFTGNNDLGFPNTDLFNQVKYQDPDLLFFSGDQIYEGVGGFGDQRKPPRTATLDYLRKWYLYGWAYGELLKDRPSIAIPDDHDVYHGNIWGENGKPVRQGISAADAQDYGGYKMPAVWVNMVQKTQTGHLPDPYDPTPVEQGIGVYYTEYRNGGISFAILEDRKFKSSPKPLLPQANIVNGWAVNRTFNARMSADVSGARLLGERQLRFLNDWNSDWTNQTWMKVVLSQTIFSNVATLPAEEAYSDAIVPRLRILTKEEYPPNDIPVADFDSDGWPQTGRDKAIKSMRKAFALHIAGDQHLGSFIQYGVNDFRDAGYAFCVPAISNIWPRRWMPMEEGAGKIPGSPRYAGNFEDGFNNKMTVFAASNPIYTGMKPAKLYDRATGFGIIRFEKSSRNILIECWPRQTDPGAGDTAQYDGWPVKINQMDNAFQTAEYELPTIHVHGLLDPVVKVLDAKTGEIVYTIRINGSDITPVAPGPGVYDVMIGEPDLKIWKNIGSLIATPVGSSGNEITINFN